jgi:hypothetical protein
MSHADPETQIPQGRSGLMANKTGNGKFGVSNPTRSERLYKLCDWSAEMRSASSILFTV